MSATRVAQDALDFSKQLIKSMPFDRVWDQIAQEASNYIWIAAPWRWTMGVITPITLTAASQTFTVASPPSDYLRLEQCFISDGHTAREVKPVSSIPGAATLTRQPNYVATNAISGATPSQIIFEALYPVIPVGQTHQFWAWYKKIVPNLINNLQTPGALLMDDDYYQLYTEWVLYYAYRYADDQRAGGATVTVTAQGDRQIAYSGQLAVAHAALEELRRSELILYSFPKTPSPEKDH